MVNEKQRYIVQTLKGNKKLVLFHFNSHFTQLWLSVLSANCDFRIVTWKSAEIPIREFSMEIFYNKLWRNKQLKYTKIPNFYT